MKKTKTRSLALALCLSLAFALPVSAEEAPALTAQAAPERTPASLGLKEAVYSGGEVLEGYEREAEISARDADSYAHLADTGIYTLRGDNFRRNAAFGTCEVSLGEFEKVWEYGLGGLKTSDSGMLYGVGWNCQAAVVKWAREVRQSMPLYDWAKSTSALREVIFTCQDGKVYFLDLMTGAPTRDPIVIGYPLRGSVSVDAMGRPMLSFGQAVSKMPSGTGEIGFYLYDLVAMEPLLFINGRRSADQVQYSTNGAFDSCALSVTGSGSDALVIAGENGLLYTLDLNAEMVMSDGKITLAASPEYVYMNSLAADEREIRTAIEGAVSMYDKYVFTGDAWGILRCVDTAVMKTVWTYDNGDNTDAAMALDLTEEGLALYTGNTTYARLSKKNAVSVHRLDAMTGEEIWTWQIDCVKNTSVDEAGCKASPVIGQKGLGDYVYFTVNQVREGGAVLVCLRKSDGQEVWRKAMAESVSSPVAVYSEFGEGRIIQCDGRGNIFLLDGLTGEEIARASVDGTIEASPAVYRDLMIIGTSDKNAKMYCFRIR